MGLAEGGQGAFGLLFGEGEGGLALGYLQRFFHAWVGGWVGGWAKHFYFFLSEKGKRWVGGLKIPYLPCTVLPALSAAFFLASYSARELA